jgi:hypothetical protein
MRKMDNETCRDAGEAALLRLAVDKALDGEVGDRAEDRYTAPSRVAHRKLVKSVMFRSAW